jgi:hypothetical protein
MLLLVTLARSDCLTVWKSSAFGTKRTNRVGVLMSVNPCRPEVSGIRSLRIGQAVTAGAPKSRRDQLSDNRTWTVAVKLEMLHQRGYLPSEPSPALCLLEIPVPAGSEDQPANAASRSAMMIFRIFSIACMARLALLRLGQRGAVGARWSTCHRHERHPFG